MKTPVQLIVGLGNPGPDYQNTRHNAGEDFVVQLAQSHGHTLSNTPKFFGYSGRISIDGQDMRLLVPTTFMNRSGQAVAALSQFYKIPADAILVAHDELDLSPGVARLKIGGGHGGHNGLRDIISALGNCRDFARLRLGIGHPGESKQVANFVLKKAPSAERQLTEEAADKSIKIIDELASGNWNKAMLNLHSK